MGLQSLTLCSYPEVEFHNHCSLCFSSSFPSTQMTGPLYSLDQWRWPTGLQASVTWTFSGLMNVFTIFAHTATIPLSSPSMWGKDVGLMQQDTSLKMWVQLFITWTNGGLLCGGVCAVSRWMVAHCKDSKERVISSFDVHVVPTRYNSQVVELSPIVVLTTVLCPSALASCLFNCCRVSGAINIILQTSRLLVYKWLTWICRIFTYWYFIISWKLEPCTYPIT